MFIDTHAHLDLPEFRNESSIIIGRAKTAGVQKIINIGTCLESSKKSIDLSRRYPEIYATVGIHPDASNELNLETREVLTDMSQSSKVVAIGEVGLDYYYLKRSSKFSNYPNREKQIFCFEQMLDLALETKLPVIIHGRESEADLIAILKSYAGSIRGVIHCFSGDWNFAEKILDLGFAISFTGNITFKNNFSIEEVIKKIPLGSIMIETDCPFLAPEPYRGKRNEPAYVVEVAKKIAQIKKLSLAQVEEETTKKAKKMFKIS